ncbi:MAG: hypothetical protein JKY37_10660 [Nannocystaceae bacterium]|nr:hypothetical protein [Nannocystaceae bacterium]
MSEDYVWDKTGAAAPDLLALEHNLSTLRHCGPLGPLPVRLPISGAAPVGWIRPMTLGAVLSAALTLLLIWAFVRVGEATPTATTTVEGPPPVAAPSENGPSAVSAAKGPESEPASKSAPKAKPASESKSAPKVKSTSESKSAPKAKPRTAPRAKPRTAPKSKREAAPKSKAAPQIPFASDSSGTDGGTDCILDPSKCGEPSDASLPETLTSNQIKAAIAPWKAEAQACGPKHGGIPGEKITVKLSIEGATGEVRANATGSNLNTPLGRCVASALAKAIFPRFRKSSLGVRYPIRL